MAASKEKVREGHCVLFILPRKNQTPDYETLALFGAMEGRGIPFRRAYADDPLEYSIPDQLPSLILAAGGLPHRSPTGAAGASIWTLGVDLSHRIGQPTSTLAVTLVNPDGMLVGAWTKKQSRDETVRISTVSTLLEQCQHRLASIEGNRS